MESHNIGTRANHTEVVVPAVTNSNHQQNVVVTQSAMVSAPNVLSTEVQVLGHNNMDPKLFKCKHCSFIGKNRMSLLGHMKTHSRGCQSRALHCYLCGEK